MDIHEYQAKEILKKFGISVPPFFVISNLESLKQVIQEAGWQQAVLKVQVHAGGRGKAGGVKFARSYDQILAYGKELLGMNIITNQTGKEGLKASCIIVSEPIEIAQEYYLGVVMDRKNAQALLIGSPEGGMDIEEVAARHPEKIIHLTIPLSGDMRSYQLWRLANFIGWKGETAKEGMKIATALAKAFIQTDACLLEINPLVQTTKGKLLAIDAKLSVDNNALWRQPEIKDYYDPTQLSPNEAKANEFGLSYISLDGNIGCVVNGAGLAMATMDIILHYGGKPANFLDIGGGATQEKIAEGFKIILMDRNVKAILVNIFGGIMNCETLAAGLIKAAKELHIKVPIVIRMEGTHVNKGKELLAQSGLNLIVAPTFAEAAKKVVEVGNAHSH